MKKLMLMLSVIMVGSLVFAQAEDFFTVGKCLTGNCVNGKGKAASDNGDEYNGMFKNGKPYGKGVLATSSGKRYEGSFSKNEFNGTLVYTDDETKIIKETGNFIRDVENSGPDWVFITGSRYEGGKLAGVCENGICAESRFGMSLKRMVDVQNTIHTLHGEGKTIKAKKLDAELDRLIKSTFPINGMITVNKDCPLIFKSNEPYENEFVFVFGCTEIPEAGVEDSPNVDVELKVPYNCAGKEKNKCTTDAIAEYIQEYPAGSRFTATFQVNDHYYGLTFKVKLLKISVIEEGQE